MIDPGLGFSRRDYPKNRNRAPIRCSPAWYGLPLLKGRLRAPGPDGAFKCLLDEALIGDAPCGGFRLDCGQMLKCLVSLGRPGCGLGGRELASGKLAPLALLSILIPWPIIDGFADLLEEIAPLRPGRSFEVAAHIGSVPPAPDNRRSAPHTHRARQPCGPAISRLRA